MIENNNEKNHNKTNDVRKTNNAKAATSSKKVSADTKKADNKDVKEPIKNKKRFTFRPRKNTQKKQETQSNVEQNPDVKLYEKLDASMENALVEVKAEKKDIKPETRKDTDKRPVHRSTNKKPGNTTHKANTEHSENTKNAKNVKNVNNTRNTPNTRNSKNGKKPNMPIKIYFLGGLNEIGKNMTVYEYNNDMVIVDSGLAFPDSEMLGVDIVIPDFTFVEANKDKIKGIVVTHGHEDHIGSLPYLLKKFNVPIYATRLTLGLIEGKLREHGLLDSSKLNEIKPGDRIKLGEFEIEPIRVNHSIPDAIGLAIKTREGMIVETGDFKVDSTPIEGEMIDLARFAELGKKGVLALLSDSTNAERPGYSASERTVGQSFANLFAKAENKRIIVATFASNIHRVQQIIDAAYKHGRKVAVSGRSMVNVVAVAEELGYLHIPEGVLVDIDLINKYPKDKMVLITTGSQGEPLSALARMASSSHRKVQVGSDDFIIISATPIPGNEKLVSRVVNELMQLGCTVIYEKMYEVHVSGHACQEELKMMLSLVKPKYFIPVHGERKHLEKHALLAKEIGIPANNIFIGKIGDSVEITKRNMKRSNPVPAGQTLVDGLGVGDVGSIVLRDRKHLAQDGLIVAVVTIDGATGTLVAGPDVVSRGFVYVREAEKLMDESRNIIKYILEDCIEGNTRDWTTMKNKIRDGLSRYLYERTKRSPMILPIIMEI